MEIPGQAAWKFSTMENGDPCVMEALGRKRHRWSAGCLALTGIVFTVLLFFIVLIKLLTAVLFCWPQVIMSPHQLSTHVLS